jgi:hypothetical protein
MTNEKSNSLFLRGTNSQFVPKVLFALLLSSISFASLAHADGDEVFYTEDDCHGVIADPSNACYNGVVFPEIQTACEAYDPSFSIDCTAVQNNQCDDALTYNLSIPVNGLRADVNEAQANAQLESQGVPADQRDCIIEKQLAAQRIANATLGDNMLTNALTKCANEHQLTYGTKAQHSSYIARVTSSEEDPIFAPPCACKDVDIAGPRGSLGTLDFNSADVEPKYFVLCGNNLQETGQNAFVHYSNNHYEACGSRSHVHFEIRSASAASIDLDETDPDEIQFTDGTIKKGANKNCAFESSQIAHRTNHSCFHPDTNIMLGDGSYKKIKRLKVGDLVWNPLSKKAVALQSVVVGPEPTPLIEMSFGERTLIVSERHPMIQPAALSKQTTWFKPVGLKSGELGHSPAFRIKMAGELSVGDFVVTEDGSTKQITHLKRLPVDEDQIVYNLTLEGEGAALKNRSVVAEGFVTGDYLIQLAINKNKIH